MKTIYRVLLIFFLIFLLYKVPYKETIMNKEKFYYLHIPNTSINEPLVQAMNNTYYLDHDFLGNKNKLGAIFLDYRVTLEDKVLLIYGHNSQTYSVPFRELENYYEEGYGKEHSVIRINENGKTLQFKLFSVFIAYEDFFYMQIPQSEEEFREYLSSLEKSSWYSFSNEEEKKEKVLIIQTCSFHKKYKSYKKKYLLLAAYLDCVY